MKLSQGKFKSARNDYVISMDTGYVHMMSLDSIINVAHFSSCDMSCQ